MPSRGRHQTTSKECRAMIRRIEALDQFEAVARGSHSASQEAWSRESLHERC